MQNIWPHCFDGEVTESSLVPAKNNVSKSDSQLLLIIFSGKVVMGHKRKELEGLKEVIRSNGLRIFAPILLIT